MTEGGTSLLEIVLWILLANALLIATAYGAVQWLMRRTQVLIGEISGRVQQFDTRIATIAAFLQNYDDIHYEPFLTPVNRLIQETQEIDNQVQQLDHNIQNLQAEIVAPALNQLQRIINAPFNWLRRFRYANSLLKESGNVDTRLAEAVRQSEQIYELPWQVALQARQARQQVEEMARHAQALRQKGAQGGQLQSASARIPVLQRSLNDISPDFLKAEKSQLLDAAREDETIKVFEVLTSVRPVIEHWLPLLREWDQNRQRAGVELNSIQQATAGLRQSLAQPHPGLQPAPIRQRLDQLASLSANLEKKLAQPDVEQIKPLLREATRTRKLIEDTQQQLMRAGQRAEELGRTLLDLRKSIEALAAQYAELEKKEHHPLIWDDSGTVLVKMRQALQAMGPADQARTPEQINAAFEQNAKLRERHKELSEKYQTTAGQYQALLALLQSSEVREGAAWARKLREMIAQAEIYDARNWPKPDTITSLKSDLEGYATLQERLAPAGQALPVKESSLSERLKDTQRLVAQQKEIQGRAEMARARLEKIQALEDEGSERLKSAWTALERASILADNNELLFNLATAEIKRLRDELKRLGDELNQPSQGVIEKKVQVVQAQATAVFQAMQGWLARLETENSAIARQISDRLIELDAVASLEDPPFEEARKLLARDDLRPAGSSALRNPLSAKNQVNEQDISAELKRKNDLWQSLLSVQQALEEKSAPVLAAYREAMQARSQAQEILGEIGTQLSNKRNWPPSGQTPLPENQGLAPINSKLDSMKKQHVRSDWAILELGRLARQYQEVTAQANQLIDRIRQDQETIYDIEDRIENLKERWYNMAQASPENMLLSNGVQQLLSRTDSQVAYIRQQYMRGSLSFSEVERNLQLLYDEVYTARVPVDENRDMGLQHQQQSRNGNTRFQQRP